MAYPFAPPPSDLSRTKQWGGLIPGEMNMDIGIVTEVRQVGAVDTGVDERGAESDEFQEDISRYTCLVDVRLLSRTGDLRNVPYSFASLSGSGIVGGMPSQGNGVLISYFGPQRNPVAYGGMTLWRTLRRIIGRGLIPELKPGEAIQQASIRRSPMSHFEQPASESDPGQFSEVLPGARVYTDFKGRLVMESRHYREGDDNGAFVRLVLGNPAASAAEDEGADFNAQEALSGAYVAAQWTVAADESSDPVFVANITKSGQVSFQFTKGWFGKTSTDGISSPPQTTVEVETEEDVVILDGDTIKSGRDAVEAAVLGDTLKQLLSDLIDAIINIRQPVAGAGPTAGPPVNIAELISIKTRLITMLSETNKVE